MKIFYAIQATGNGHIARAVELLPYLQQYGEVSFFLSGSNSNLQPGLPVKYRSKGLSLFYSNSGGLDYRKMLRAFEPLRVWKEARQLPVEQYDLVINDFESITALACWLKKVPSINFGHQASFHSPFTPRPAKRDRIGELVLQRYAPANAYAGLHFEQYDEFIFSPIIKQQVLQASPADKEHITVYLSHYADEVIAAQLKLVPGVRFEVFSKKVKQPVTDGNITFIPIHNEAFSNSMINSRGVITGAGFETPAEALYLGKRLLCLPIKGQYEQSCNAAALEKLGVSIAAAVTSRFHLTVQQWLNAPAPAPLQLKHSAAATVRQVVEMGRALYGRKHGYITPVLPEKEGLAVI